MLDPRARAILVGAKERLAKGWIQGVMEDDGKMCLVGAVVSATSSEMQIRFGGFFTEDVPTQKAFRQVMDRLSEETGVLEYCLSGWNDSPDRTVDEVIGVIDKILLSDSPQPEISRSTEREIVLNV